MALNILNFVVAQRVARNVLDEKGVPDSDTKAKRLALVSAVWPGAGGEGLTLMPVLIARTLAQREAEGSAGGTAQTSTPQAGSGGTPPPGPEVPQDKLNELGQKVAALETRVATIESRFKPYDDQRSRTVTEARTNLEGSGFSVRVEGSAPTVARQSPDPAQHKQLAVGATVTLYTNGSGAPQAN